VLPVEFTLPVFGLSVENEEEPVVGGSQPGRLRFPAGKKAAEDQQGE